MFSEKAGQPGPSFFLKGLADKLTVLLRTGEMEDALELPFELQQEGVGKGAFASKIEASPPYALETSLPYGIFHGDSYLKYYTCASTVTTQNDWFDVQDWHTNKFEITLRDPYGKYAAAGTREGDQCPRGIHAVDGVPCVLGVIRFDGELIDFPVNVTTFTGAGEEIATTGNSDGVVILKVPEGQVFASVNYKEQAPGTVDGKDYKYIDHWATTYAVIKRDHGGEPAEGRAGNV